MSKHLIFADLHHEIDWARNTIAAENPNKITFMGDFLDNRTAYAKRPASFAESFLFMMKWAATQDVLVGNHDMANIEKSINPYAHFFYCRPCTQGGGEIIEQIMDGRDITKLFDAAAVIDCGDKKILATHAGLHESFHKGENIEEMAERINRSLKECFGKIVSMSDRTDTALVEGCGRVRGGGHWHGGVLWRDADEENNFANFHMVYGHTAHANTAIIDENKNGFKGINLDGRQSTYGLIEDGVFKIRARGVDGYRIKFNVIERPFEKPFIHHDEIEEFIVEL